MELKHIDTAKLCISAANMRAKGKADLSHILPSIRARGVLVPLIVRPADEDRFEIVAGKRRYHAALVVAEESGEAEPLPCAIMAPGDDAAALEASLIENVARLDPDEVTLWESFTRLVREGRSPEDIALAFGLTELQVKRTLALGNLLPRIRGLYRKGDIDAATVRHLTLASKARQRDWLGLFDDPDTHCPTGHQLKAWLFGGASVSVRAALFDLADYPGELVSDLFGEERFFADTTSFWAAQTPAIEAKAEGYREAGWSEVVILPSGEAFHSWKHERCPKRKGGKVFLAVSARGEVTVHDRNHPVVGWHLLDRPHRRRPCWPIVFRRPALHDCGQSKLAGLSQGAAWADPHGAGGWQCHRHDHFPGIRPPNLRSADGKQQHIGISDRALRPDGSPAAMGAHAATTESHDVDRHSIGVYRPGATRRPRGFAFRPWHRRNRHPVERCGHRLRDHLDRALRLAGG
ncbi:ParB/RepB/Spo0J family partition protein [Sphingomonas kyeonggiensis]|uniref:ParB/RepB/Spo0J family partition protein n=1 Tax=Sphingomonas kyeonggiensis TaxID=1268553 RepID=A0A7W6JXQ2_9SPHN|nr:ParB/RepB/Spo0J family partition protein [Sphingomonas kyeonggiensis]